MSSGSVAPRAAVRPRRSAGPVVAVTGATSPLGLRLTRALVGASGVRRVVAVAGVRGDVEGATWRIADITSPELASRISKVDTVVHCGVDLGVAADPGARSRSNVRGAQAVLTAAAAVGVRRVVLVTSAMVYGAVDGNAVPLAEDAPVHAVPDGDLVDDLLEIERLAERARTAHPALEVTVVRPAALVGEGVDSVFTRHFEAPRLLVVRGTRPHWQFCHIDDLVSALVLTATTSLGPVVTVGCEGWLEQEAVEALSGMRRIELPAAVAIGTAERLHRLGLSPAPATELQYVMHPWVVPSSRLREAGWRPVHDNTTALEALLEQVGGHHAVAARRLGRKDATLGAAGAAVAVVGTAALVRAARKRRHG